VIIILLFSLANHLCCRKIHKESRCIKIYLILL